ncbi:MAG: hypothetical protein AAGA58_19045 [Verrucomicrobiota bacterium]
MNTQIVRSNRVLAASMIAILALSGCSLPRLAERDATSSLSTANLDALTQTESTVTTKTEEPSELPEALLVAGPAYEGERHSPWDMPADEFVTLVERSEQQQGDESLLAQGDLLAYASSVLQEAREDADPAGEIAEQPELENVPVATPVQDAMPATSVSVTELAFGALPPVAADTANIVAADVEELDTTTPSEEETTEEKSEEPNVEGIVTSRGNFTIAGAITRAEEDETAALPRMPVGVHERFVTVESTARFQQNELLASDLERTALGSGVQTGIVRSASADWSKFPVGTRFRLVGDPSQQEYVIDDFAEFLVGSNAVELALPSEKESLAWGSRNIVLEILNWGSFEKSMTIIQSSESRMQQDHVLQMVGEIQQRFESQTKAARGVRPESGLLGKLSGRRAD